ncbi:unnamed protein product, partial [Darwinula stevensoni]
MQWVWTWSLSQFTLVMSATKGRKQRLGMTWTPEPEPIPVPELEEGDPETKERKSWIWDIVDMDIIAILTTVVLQDGPFLIIRMVLIFHYNVVSYLNIFFTCKNTLVATLQIYRLFVLICEKIRKKHKLAREAEEEGFGEYSDSELEGQLSSISEDEQFRLSQALRQNEEDPDFDLRKWLEEEISNHLKRRNSTVRGIPPPMTPINEEEESVKSDPATRRRSQESKRSFAPSRKPSKDKKQVKDEEKDLEVKEKKNETGKKKGKLKRETSEESSNSDSSGKKKKHKNRVKPKNPVKPKKGKEETSDESSDEESTSGTTVSTVEDAKKRKKKRLSRKRRTGRDADATLLDQLRTALMTSKKLPSRRSSMKEMGMNQFPRNISRMSLRDLALEEGDSTSDGGGRVIFQIESEIEEHPKKLWEEMERYKLKKKMKHIEGGATPKAIPPMFHCNTPSPYGMSSPQLLHSQVGSISSLRNLEKWYEGARSRAEFPPDHVDYPSGIPRMRARPPPFDTMSLHGLSRTQSVGRLDMDNASFTSLPTNKMESFKRKAFPCDVDASQHLERNLSVLPGPDGCLPLGNPCQPVNEVRGNRDAQALPSKHSNIVGTLPQSQYSVIDVEGQRTTMEGEILTGIRPAGVGNNVSIWTESSSHNAPPNIPSLYPEFELQ